jgi:hypothetical protein
MLLPGDNKIKVECKDLPKDVKVALTYSWFGVDKDDWQSWKTAAQTRTQAVTQSPAEFMIQAPATKHFPKMDFIRLECR